MANAPAPDDVPISTPPPRPALMPTEPLWTDFAPEAKPAAAAPRLREPVPIEPPPAPRLPPPPSLPVAAHSAVSTVPKAAVPAATPGAKTAVPAATPGARTAVPAMTPAAKTAKLATSYRTLLNSPRVSPWIAAALGVVVLVEGGVIAALLMRQPAAGVASPSGTGSSSISSDATRLSTAPVVRATLVVEPQPTPPPKPGADPITAAAGNQRSGGVRLVTPIELKVVQGDKVLGSTADGPIIAPAGTHQLDLSNAALGFRTRMSVTFRSGQITSVNVTVPSGKVSLNAQPWGEAFIDGRSVGETPLANLSVPLGEHEVLFRHPSLGERRQTITVRADAPARVSATFDK